MRSDKARGMVEQTEAAERAGLNYQILLFFFFAAFKLLKSFCTVYRGKKPTPWTGIVPKSVPGIQWDVYSVTTS